MWPGAIAPGGPNRRGTDCILPKDLRDHVYMERNDPAKLAGSSSCASDSGTTERWRPSARIACLLGSMLSLAGCDPFASLDPDAERDGPTDGMECEVDDDCSTGACTQASLCSHSSCRCSGDECGPEGQAVDACREGWVCVDAKSILDPVSEFFGRMPAEDRGYCQPTCDAGCPEHYFCDAEGRFCEPDRSWADPRPTVRWSGAASGEYAGVGQSTTVQVEGGATVTLEGDATSPVDAPVTMLQWNVVSSSGEREEYAGSTLEIPVPADLSYRRVEFTARDEAFRSATVTVVFETCFGPGEVCGYEGSGCCNGCDAQGELCL